MCDEGCIVIGTRSRHAEPDHSKRRQAISKGGTEGPQTHRWREMDSNHWSPFTRSNHIRASTRRLSIIRSGMRFRPSSPAKSPSATKAEEPGSRDPRLGDRRNLRGGGELIGAPTAGTPSYAALAGSCLRL